MKKSLLISFILFYAIYAHSQQVTVTEKSTQLPLPGVTVYSKTPYASVITNGKGLAELSSFRGADSIEFRHIGYHTVIISYAKLESRGFQLSLSEKSHSLDEIVISASRFEEKREDVPQQMQVIKASDLSFANQQTSADVIQNSGNVLVQKSQMGGGSPIIRGFEANKVLIVMDGVRLNNAIYRGGHLQNVMTLDNSVLEKVEIVFGPGSVVYGSDALGGVMHFYSRRPELADSGSGVLIKAAAFTRYSSASREKSNHLDINFGGQKIGSFTGITFSSFGDLRQGNIRNPFYGDWGKSLFYTERIDGKDSMIANPNPNIQKNSGYSQYDFLQKFLFRQNRFVTHQLNLQYSTSSDVPRYDRLTLLKGKYPRYAEWYYGPQKRFFSSYSLELFSEKGMYDHARIIAAFQNIEESRFDRTFGETIRRHRTENIGVFTLNADFDKRINRNEFRYGIEGAYNIVHSKANTEDIITGAAGPLDTRYPDGGSDMKSAAAYFTHTFEVSEKFILTEGVRYSQIGLHSVFTDNTFFPFPFTEVKQASGALNGNIGMVLMPGRGWRQTATLSSGFRTPNVDDLSKVFESVPGNVIVPNPDLKPEYTYNLDIGVSKTFSELITLSATGFATKYNNAISTEAGQFNGSDSILYEGQMSLVTMSVNKREAVLFGYNLVLSGDITDNFSITSTLNWTRGRIITYNGSVPLDHIPPVFGKTGFSLSLKKFKSELFVMYNGWKRLEDYNLVGEDNFAQATPNGMPAWMTLNVRASWQVNQYLQLQGAMENMLDQNYRVFASGISAPGRNVVLTLRVKV